MVQGLRFRVQGLWFSVQGSVFAVSTSLIFVNEGEFQLEGRAFKEVNGFFRTAVEICHVVKSAQSDILSTSVLNSLTSLKVCLSCSLNLQQGVYNA